MDVEVACDQIGVGDVQKGRRGGKRMRGTGEWSGTRVAAHETRKIRAKTSLWHENVHQHEVVRFGRKKRSYRERVKKLLGQTAGHSGPCNRSSKIFKTTKTRKKPFGRWEVLQ